VFIARRAKGQNCAGGWEFPGGKIEGGESPEHCLQRELQEEFAIEAEVGDFFAESIYEYPQGAIRLLAYFVIPHSMDFKLRVHDEYRWIKISDLLSCGLLPADIPIAEKLATVR
jgi:8-oxo-dGTP diphosphatase